MGDEGGGVNQQLPIVWLSLPDRLRAAAAIYQWLAPLMRAAADRIDQLEKGR